MDQRTKKQENKGTAKKWKQERSPIPADILVDI